MTPTIERAIASDLADVLALLKRNHLPGDGLPEHFATALVARQDGAVIGSAALELYPDGALLRSVAVAPFAQGRGLGQQLTAAALRLAVELRMPAVYLLTTTADAFFPKFGFERISRGEVPATVKTSVEFTSACCSTAVVMRRTL